MCPRRRRVAGQAVSNWWWWSWPAVRTGAPP